MYHGYTVVNDVVCVHGTKLDPNALVPILSRFINRGLGYEASVVVPFLLKVATSAHDPQSIREALKEVIEVTWGSERNFNAEDVVKALNWVSMASGAGEIAEMGERGLELRLDAGGAERLRELAEKFARALVNLVTPPLNREKLGVLTIAVVNSGECIVKLP